MLLRSRNRALCALILILSLALAACTVTEISPETAPPETKAPRDGLGGLWTAPFEAGGELMRALGFDLAPWLSEPLRGELRLSLNADGSCTLTRDYAPCAAVLRPALAACARELQQSESEERLSGLRLAQALGADPNDFAAALCDELLPPAETRQGRWSESPAELRWSGGGLSSFSLTADGLLLDGILYSPLT